MSELSLFDETVAPIVDKPFVVVAYRSAASMFGRGEELVKGEDGKPLRFESMSDAKAQADKWNKRLASSNVSYAAECRQ
jgi:hypothetical protein